ncbi:MAG: ABC transporter ATP-binding protein [Anaerolineaceae bacterium]|nr:MAG: ABC transporter ATP-binding protein [Anaerolineaceae bacterium]
MDEIIKVSKLYKYFRDVKAVDDISFSVKRGELFGYLGVNGAGKSTTINMLCTLYAPDIGEIEICGYELGKDNNAIRSKLGVVFQHNTLDALLSVRQNLLSRAYLYEKDSSIVKRNLDMVCDTLDIGSLLDRQYRKLSGGQKRRCEIARAIMNQPEILFLDEPTTGLDPQTRRMVWSSVERLRKEYNMTIFLTTHYMEEAARAQNVAVIDQGKIVAYASPTKLKETYASDRIRVFSDSYDRVIEIADKYHMTYKEKSNHLTITVPDTMSAIPILNELSPYISSFEVVQGTMDDAFLNITGKPLVEAV